METESNSRSRLVAALIAAGCLAMAGVTLSACNTVKGVGKDIEAVGEAGQEAIDDTADD